jgi:hypothetical protein
VSLGSTVGIRSRLWTARWRNCLWIPAADKIFYFSPKRLRDGVWRPPCLICSGYRGFFSGGVKRLKHAAVHLLQPTAAVKNEWSCTCTPHSQIYQQSEHKNNCAFKEQNLKSFLSCVESDSNVTSAIFSESPLQQTLPFQSN